jgi:hypothetical protein
VTSKVLPTERQKLRPHVLRAILPVTAQMGPIATKLLSLQRSIGNRATLQTLQRLTVDGPDTPTTRDELRERIRARYEGRSNTGLDINPMYPPPAEEPAIADLSKVTELAAQSGPGPSGLSVGGRSGTLTNPRADRDQLNQRRQEHRLLGGYEGIKPGDRAAELPTVPSAAGKGQTTRLNKLNERRTGRGPIEADRVDEVLNKRGVNNRLRKERTAKAEADDQAARAKWEKESKDAAEREAPFDDLYHSVPGEMARSHPRLKAKVPATLAAEVAKVSSDAALLGRGDPGVALGTPLAARAQALRSAWDAYVTKSLKAAQFVADDAYRGLIQGGLNQIITLDVPELRNSKAKIDALMADDRWFEAEDELPRLRTLLLAGPAARWKEITDRQTALNYLGPRAQTPAEATDVANWNADLAVIRALPLAAIPTELVKFDPKLILMSDRVAQAEFQGTDAQKLQALEDLYDNRLIRRGMFNKKYPTTWDGTTGYSVEYSVAGYNSIVIHAHCQANGTPRKVHWKYRGHKYEQGSSHELSPRMAKALVGPASEYVNARLGTLQK